MVHNSCTNLKCNIIYLIFFIYKRDKGIREKRKSFVYVKVQHEHKTGFSYNTSVMKNLPMNYSCECFR